MVARLDVVGQWYVSGIDVGFFFGSMDVGVVRVMLGLGIYISPILVVHLLVLTGPGPWVDSSNGEWVVGQVAPVALTVVRRNDG